MLCKAYFLVYIILADISQLAIELATASLNADFEKKNELGKPPISGHTYISQVCKIMQKQNFYVQNWREIQKI